jgi:hypothetical protein
MAKRPLNRFKVVVVRSDGTVNVRAIVLRNIYAEPIERGVAKRPLQRSIDPSFEVIGQAPGVALGGGDFIRAAIEREGDARTTGLYDAIGACELAEIGRVLPNVLSSCRFWAFFCAFSTA